MKSVFLPMDAEGQPKLEEPRQSSTGAEKRRFSRHRYTNSIEIRVEDPRGRFDEFDAMTFEISEGGLSAATPNILVVGETVQLNPVMGFRVKAIVRRKNGAMYGFEFINLVDKQRETIRKQCEKLPLFSSMIDV
jgi:hypothetical protein